MELSQIISTLINVGMVVTYVLLGLCLLAFVAFAIWQVVQNPARSKTALFGILGTLIAFGVAYLLASGTDISEIVFEKTGTSLSSSRWIGAGLITTYILFFGTIVSLLAVEIVRPFKK